MRNIFYPCRVYAFTMNPYGRDSWEFNGKADDEKSLYEILDKIRDEFHDNYKELDRYVYLTDEKEIPFDVKPSTILKRVGGESEKQKKKQIQHCQHCFYLIDEKMSYCPDFGKIGCEKCITVTEYWSSPEGKKRAAAQEEEEKEYWKNQPAESRRLHELDEKYSDLLNQWGSDSISKEEEKELNRQMDEIAREMKELNPDFVDYRSFCR